MRVAVVFFSKENNDKLRALAAALAEGIEEQGHFADLVDGNHDVNTKLTIYDYIVVGTESISTFGGQISRRVSEFLANSGIISGKRSCAFIASGGIRTGKTLESLMKCMEFEGMYLKYSDIISSKDQARYIGTQLHIS